jgi:hypothetical protein
VASLHPYNNKKPGRKTLIFLPGSRQFPISLLSQINVLRKQIAVLCCKVIFSFQFSDMSVNRCQRHIEVLTLLDTAPTGYTASDDFFLIFCQ